MQLVRLSSYWGRMQPTASTAHSVAPVPCACTAVPTLSALCEAGCLPCSLPLPLAVCPLGTSLSMLPKHKSGMADARASGNCTPRLWDSDSTSPCQAWTAEAHQTASHHLCPFGSSSTVSALEGKRCFMELSDAFSTVSECMNWDSSHSTVNSFLGRIFAQNSL